jgi:hypothetical protein
MIAHMHAPIMHRWVHAQHGRIGTMIVTKEMRDSVVSTGHAAPVTGVTVSRKGGAWIVEVYSEGRQPSTASRGTHVELSHAIQRAESIAEVWGVRAVLLDGDDPIMLWTSSGGWSFGLSTTPAVADWTPDDDDDEYWSDVVFPE